METLSHLREGWAFQDPALHRVAEFSSHPESSIIRCYADTHGRRKFGLTREMYALRVSDASGSFM
jgi:hypothetical protein